MRASYRSSSFFKPLWTKRSAPTPARPFRHSQVLRKGLCRRVSGRLNSSGVKTPTEAPKGIFLAPLKAPSACDFIADSPGFKTWCKRQCPRGHGANTYLFHRLKLVHYGEAVDLPHPGEPGRRGSGNLLRAGLTIFTGATHNASASASTVSSVATSLRVPVR